MTDLTQSDLERPRVLLVANYESDVGYAWWLMENFWVVASEEISRLGGHCTLAYPRITQVPESVLAAPLEVVEFAIQPTGIGAILRSMRFIREHRITAVYLTDWSYWHACYALWRLVGVRSIVIHDHNPGDRPPSRGLRSFLKRAIHSFRLFSADRYVAVSQFVEDRIVENANVSRERCIVVTNGIRIFECPEDSRAAVRSELGIAPDSTLIVLVSRATHYKNIGFAVRCIHQLLEDPDMVGRVDVVHCGDGPELEEFRELARELGLEKVFRFLGRRGDARQIMCAADIGLHPSNGEALSLAILEMMCAELPVVASDLDSVSGVFQHDVSGLKYRQGNLDDAVQNIRRLVSDPSLRQQIGLAAGRICRENYSLEATNHRFANDVVPWLSPHLISKR